MASSTPKQYRLAILDDYSHSSLPSLSSTTFPNLTITTFTSTISPSTPSGLASLTTRLLPFDIISTMRERTPFPQSLITSLPSLKLLLTTGMRNASLDLPAFTAAGIPVSGTCGKPDAPPQGIPPKPPGTHDSTTQQALSLLLSLTSRIPVDHGRITSSQSPSAWQSGTSINLHGRTLGVLGLGRLGTNFARLCVQAFQMRIIAWSANLTQEKADEAAANAGLPEGSFKVVSKETLFREADVLSLHLVLSERTRGIVGREEFALMKPKALLVNTARAGLMDEDAVFEVLSQGKIYGAAFDVMWEEPLPAESKWRSTKWAEGGRSMLIISPHMGYVDEISIPTWYQEQAGELRRWLDGEPLRNKMN